MKPNIQMRIAIILLVIEVQLSARALEYHLTDLKDKEDNIF